MKSYFANSFRVAMEQARKELGPDAMLVTTRTSALEARHLGEYEVVFAAGLPPASDSPAAVPSAPEPDLSAMLAEMRRKLKAGRSAPAALPEPSPAAARRPHARELFDELVQREVAPEIAQRLVSAAENRLPSATPTSLDLRSALTEEIQNSFPVDSRLIARPDGSPIKLALVGPPGTGKTATIAKLAVRFGLTARKRAVLISLDTLRVGASEQLRCYASLLGLGFQTAETNRALEQSLEEHRGKELILIDTPGFSLSDLAAGCDSAGFLARRADIQKHLVLPASMRYADMARLAAAYEVFKPSRSIFTRMDETGAFGSVLNQTIASSRPAAFFCAGQRVPEDLADATKRHLADLLLPSTPTLTAPARAVEILPTAA